MSFSIVLGGCGEQIAPDGVRVPSEIVCNLVDATGCKDLAMTMDSEAPTSLDCIFWDYDGSDVLKVIHVNTALNCCPGTIVGLVDIDRENITIEETEGDDALMCLCLCLYDLSYEISGIQGGEVTITFVEPYLPEGEEILSVTIDLNAEPQGIYSLLRTTYPWGLGGAGEDPEGTLEGYIGCKTVTGTFAESSSATSIDSSCVTVLTYPDDWSIRIVLSNTAFNCCIDALDAEFNISAGQITITGLESPPGGYCDCICLYDVSYSVHNLEPGIYTIHFVEPYLPLGEEELDITIDLFREGSWTQCVYREINQNY